MDPALRVHALADRVLQLDLTLHLLEDDTLVGTPDVKITRMGIDLTADFVAGDAQIAAEGKAVRFRKKADTAGAQGIPNGALAYILKITYATASGQTGVATHDLVITRKGAVTQQPED